MTIAQAKEKTEADLQTGQNAINKYLGPWPRKSLNRKNATNEYDFYTYHAGYGQCFRNQML